MGGLLVGHFHHFTERGMGVHLRGELTHALAAGHRIGHLLNQVSGVQAIDVGSEHFTTGLVEQQFHQTIAFQLGQGLGVGLEVAAHDTQFKSLVDGELFGIRLTEADGAYLRMGEGGRRDVAVMI